MARGGYSNHRGPEEPPAEMVPAQVERCVTCRHWREWKYDSTNICGLITDRGAEGAAAAVADGWEREDERLETGPLFGCVLWEAKDA